MARDDIEVAGRRSSLSRGRASRRVALVTTLATMLGVLSPTSSPAVAATAPTLLTATAPVCSASVSGSPLARSGWVASTNAPAGSYFAPAYALDGDPSTRFATNSSQAPGLYFQVDLGSAQSFGELAMDSANWPTDYARAYDVQVSNDNSTWATVASCTGTGTPEVVSFPTQTARYVKVVLTTAASYWWSVGEFNLYAGYSCAATVSGAPLARSGWVASTNAPAGSSYAPPYALDGDPSTRFATNSSQAPGLYFQVDLGSAQSFGELAMDSANWPTDYARAYDVQVSNDNSTWATVASCTGTGTPEVVSFPTQTARYVKVVLTTAASYWWSVGEFNLYAGSSVVGTAPVITSSPYFAVQLGTYSLFTVTATGSPTPVLSEYGALPPGMVFQANANGTATISGTVPTSVLPYYPVTITATNTAGVATQSLVISTTGLAPKFTSAATWQVTPGTYSSFTVVATGQPTPSLAKSGLLPPGMSFQAGTGGTATISGTAPTGTSGTYHITITASNGVGTPAVQDFAISVATATTTALASSANPVRAGQGVVYTATVTPVPDGGAVTFVGNGAALAGCSQVPLSTTTGRATCSTTYPLAGQWRVQASFSGHGAFQGSSSPSYAQTVDPAGPGYWLATANGHVYGAGSARSLGGVTTSATTGPVVGIAATPDRAGYWVVTANGRVSALGSAKAYGDVPAMHMRVSNIVGIWPTPNGHGYYLLGSDGGVFAFGNARYRGSLPGLGVRSSHAVGMVVAPGGAGYLVVGWDGGVFTFGARYYGSVPGLGRHVHNIRDVVPSAAGLGGYLLVGSDGGVFTFGPGAKYRGSLPATGARVTNIVAIALTSGGGGYWMAGSDAHVYNFGDAQAVPSPAGATSNLPVAAMAAL